MSLYVRKDIGTLALGILGGQARGSSQLPWYLAGNVPPSNVVAAYDFAGAATQEASYINLVGNAAYNLYGGVAPTWGAGTGLAFDGVAQYLRTGITPQSGWTLYIELADINPITSGDVAIGSRGLAGGNTWVYISTGNTPRHRYGNGGTATVGGCPATASYCVAGLSGYYNGTLDATLTPAWDAAAGGELTLGALNNLNTATIGSFYRGKIKKLALYNVTLNAIQAQALYFNARWTWPNPLPLNLGTAPTKTPAVVFTFDDEFTNAYTYGFQYMRDRNVPGTMYTVTSHVDQPGYMTLAQLLEMQAAGWVIGDHTVTHPYLSDLDLAGQTAEIGNARTQLEAWGITGAAHMAAPHGATNANTFTAATNLGMKSIRRLETGTMDIDIESIDFYGLNARSLASTLTLAVAKSLVQNAYNNRTTTMFYAHEILLSGTPAGSQWLKSDFEALVDYTIALGIPIITVDELYRLRSGAVTVRKPTLF